MTNKKEPIKKIEEGIDVSRTEIRKFKFSNEVSFEFEIDVSTPETAVAEITDFIELMEVSISELEELRKTQVEKIEKTKK